MRETVANIAQPTLLDILFDRIEGLLLGDFHLSIGPTRNLYNHVEDSIVLVGEKRDVMERRDNGAVLFDEHSVF